MYLRLFFVAQFPLFPCPLSLHFLWTLWISEAGKTMEWTLMHLTPPSTLLLLSYPRALLSSMLKSWTPPWKTFPCWNQAIWVEYLSRKLWRWVELIYTILHVIQHAYWHNIWWLLGLLPKLKREASGPFTASKHILQDFFQEKKLNATFDSPSLST